MGVRRRFRWVTFLVSREALCNSRVWGKVERLSYRLSMMTIRKLKCGSGDVMARQDLLVQQVKASARWELMKEWLEKRVEHWNPEEEYRHHLFLSGMLNHQSGGFSQVATPRSIVGSRFSEGPSF
ncbi:hypothetical protein HID58_055521, partial [Brassica napus]